MEKEKHLLELCGVSVGFPKKGRELGVVTHGVSFYVDQGEALGIVGESGSGKSVSMLASVGLLGNGGRVVEGSVRFLHGEDYITLNELTAKQLNEVRGDDISMIFQEPMTSLNPVMTIGRQVEEMLVLHTDLPKEERRPRVLAMLSEVGLSDTEALYGKYPHELSGGMRQRVMIAMAMILRPRLLIADEPTTALDVTIQAKILKLLKKFQTEYGTTVILISHDLGVIRSVCSRAVVMCGGEVVEQGEVEALFERPQKEYTKRLLAAALGKGSVLQKAETADSHEIIAHVRGYSVFYEEKLIRKKRAVGEKNSAGEDMDGMLQEAGETGPQQETGQRQENRRQQENGCQPETGQKQEDGRQPETGQRQENGRQQEKRSEAANRRERLKTFLSGKRRREVVKGVSFDLYAGEIIGVVGESGCGKSTLAKALAGLNRMTEGTADISCAQPQMVFQDPYGSLNPAKTIGWLLTEPLRLHHVGTRKERYAAACEMLEKVGLSRDYYERYPGTLSGGQRQRVAIAMAIMLRHRFILLDEPVSALDVTVQEQILILLVQLQKEFGLTYLFISHDMNVIHRICDRVFVMYQGRIVESGRTEEVFAAPKHPYTKKLLSARL